MNKEELKKQFFIECGFAWVNGQLNADWVWIWFENNILTKRKDACEKCGLPALELNLCNDCLNECYPVK